MEKVIITKEDGKKYIFLIDDGFHNPHIRPFESINFRLGGVTMGCGMGCRERFNDIKLIREEITEEEIKELG